MGRKERDRVLEGDREPEVAAGTGGGGAQPLQEAPREQQAPVLTKPSLGPCASLRWSRTDGC